MSRERCEVCTPDRCTCATPSQIRMLARELSPDPWDACRDVDPFTGQPDQHEHGDACENEGCE